jgi:threonine synthase
VTFYILKKYFDSFEDEELKECIKKAYDDKFETEIIAPLEEKEEVNFLELFHGPTLAFKDMALSILPYLLKLSAKKENMKEEIVILTATSGDTGKAALQGFSGIEGIRIIVFYPENGVSEIQRLQMLTQEGENTFVVGIDGNFDDAQNGVKEIFCDNNFNKKLAENKYVFSSANSINIARLVPQIVYYFYSYITLVKNKKIKAIDKVNVVVPTGNFGNILAAYYAKKMGLPINKLICASNENNVLYDFLRNGIYDKNRPFILTSSPSMDILISSNLERLLYDICGEKEDIIMDLMKNLKEDGKYEITEEMKEGLRDFYGGFSTEIETSESIKKVYQSSGYVMDTHTAVAYSVYEKYKAETGDVTETILVSTASPFKFPKAVATAIAIDTNNLDDFQIIEKVSRLTHLDIPQPIKELKHKKINHNNYCEKQQMKSVIEHFLKV